jgi:hypothetical protein
MSQSVTEFLDYYLDDKTPADSAVLLTGPWGGGKSHFIKAYLAAREAALQAQDHLTTKRHLYASLYGVHSTDEITAQFYAQAHPGLNSKVARLIGGLAGRALNAVTNGAAVREGDDKLIREAVLKLEGMVLIFDDLERCAMPIADVMGFINAFVEHEGLKAIVIASEADIPPDQMESFKRRKEKLIGKTLRVSSDPETVYDVLVARMKSTGAKSAAQGHKAEALQVFSASGALNFRSLRAVLEDFDRLVDRADPLLSKSPAALEDLLTYMVATGIELRAANISAGGIAKLGSAFHRMLPSMIASKEPAREDLQLYDITQKYPSVSWADPVVPPVALAALYESGELRLGEINHHLEQHPLIVGPANTPAWRRMWGWMSRGKQDYDAARPHFVEDLLQRRIKHPGEILHAAGVVISLRNWGDDLLPGQKIPSFFRKYVRALEADGTLNPDIGLFLGSFDETGWGGLGFSGVGSPEFNAVFSHVKVAVERAFDRRMQSLASELLRRLKDGELSILYEYGLDGVNFGGAPILHHVPSDDMVDLLLDGGALNERLSGALAERYSRYSHHPQMAPEKVWIANIRKKLVKRARSLNPPFRKRADVIIETQFGRIDTALKRA